MDTAEAREIKEVKGVLYSTHGKNAVLHPKMEKIVEDIVVDGTKPR